MLFGVKSLDSRLDAIQDGVIFTNLEGRIVYWNCGAEKLFGYTAEEILGQPLVVLYPSVDPAAFEADVKQVRAGRPYTGTREGRRKDGATVWLNVKTTLVQGADGAPIGFLELAKDATERRHLVTQRRMAEDAVRQREAEADRQLRLYEAILTNTPDLAYVFDMNHRFIYANEGLLKMWGRIWGEAIGKTCLELGYEPWHAAMHDREIEHVVATKQPIRGEVPFTGTFGRRIYDYIFVPVLNEQGEVEAVAGTTRDVTEQKQTEARLRQSAKMEGVGRLAGGIAHDFNNQLQAVAGFANFAARDPGLSPAARRDLEQVQKATERMAGLTRQLLAFSRQQVLQPQTLDLNAAVVEGWSLLRAVS